MGAPVDKVDYEYDEYDDYVYQIDSCDGEDYPVDVRNEKDLVNGTIVKGEFEKIMVNQEKQVNISQSPNLQLQNFYQVSPTVISESESLIADFLITDYTGDNDSEQTGGFVCSDCEYGEAIYVG